jgi:hypothetical protein
LHRTTYLFYPHPNIYVNAHSEDLALWLNLVALFGYGRDLASILQIEALLSACLVHPENITHVRGASLTVFFKYVEDG